MFFVQELLIHYFDTFYINFRMLYAFVEEQRNKKDNDNLAVTYAVAGQAADKHGSLVNNI